MKVKVIDPLSLSNLFSTTTKNVAGLNEGSLEYYIVYTIFLTINFIIVEHSIFI